MSTARTSVEPACSESAPDSATPWLNPPRAVVVAVLLAVLILFGLIRYRLRDMPLERDEGEYAYSGQLLIEGIPPYQLSYNMKLPGIYAAYAAVMEVFGQTPAGIHCGLLVVNAATLILLYLLVAPLFSRLAGLVAACSWAVLSAGSSVLGFEAHATNFVALPAIAGILALVYALRKDWRWLVFLSGFFSGVAVLMKQHGAFFVLFCLLCLFFFARQNHEARRLSVGRAGIYMGGVVLPYALTCVLLWRAGVFRQFWFWTVSYAGEYSKMGLRRAIKAFVESASGIAAMGAPIWILVLLGLTALWWARTARCHRGFLVLLLLCSFLSLCPGGYFRPHYFILILPIAAILAGVGVSSAVEWLAAHSPSQVVPSGPAVLFLVLFGAAIFFQRQAYFRTDPMEVFEATYPGSPFVAAEKVGEFIKSNSDSASRVAVIGSEPEIYFYAHRLSATGYLYMYSLTVRHKFTARMQDEFLHELDASRPEYVVYADVWQSWGGGERTALPQAERLMERLQEFMHDGYERVGVADIGRTTHYVWGPASASYRPASADVIYVLRRSAR